MSKKNKDKMLIKENQYRAVITKVDGGWSASVQKRIGIDEWKKIRCGLKGITYPTSDLAEIRAIKKIKEICTNRDALDEMSFNAYKTFKHCVDFEYCAEIIYNWMGTL